MLTPDELFAKLFPPEPERDPEGFRPLSEQLTVMRQTCRCCGAVEQFTNRVMFEYERAGVIHSQVNRRPRHFTVPRTIKIYEVEIETCQACFLGSK